MATVRLEFDLDSDVYPELHAALADLRSARARGERIRALAAAGLVWENVRIYGAGAIGPTVSAAAAVPPPPAPVVAPPVKAERAPPSERRASRPKVVAAKPRVDPRGADFIDLAIDAEPDAESVAEPDTTAAEVREVMQVDIDRDVQAVVRELPVLMDVVADSEVISDAVESRPTPLTAVSPAMPPVVATPAPEPALPPSAAHAVYELPTPSHAHHGDEALATDEDTIHLTSLAQKPATRSRLMRMKDKGLFRNG